MSRVVPLVAVLGIAVLGAPSVAAEPPGLEQSVRALAHDPDPAARARAAARLAEPGDEPARSAAVRALCAALPDPVPAVRRVVAGALARVPDPASRAPLLARLEAERDREVVPALLLALGALHDPTLVSVLEPFARDPVPAVRAGALTALGDAGGPAARRRLLAALSDPGGPDEAWIVRSSAILALAKCGAKGDIGDVLAALRQGDGWSHWLARSALAEAVPRLDPEPVRLLLHLVHDGDPRVAVTAAVGFAKSGRADRLLELLAHALPGVRAAAASGVAQAGLREAAPRLLPIARSDPALTVRWAAARALFRLGTKEGDDLVLAALGSPEAAVWAEAAAVLEQRTGERHGRDAGAWRAALARRSAK